MKYTLLTKEEVERDDFHEKAGMVNIYACGHCRAIVMYLYADKGVTPMSIKCDCCGKDAYSQLSQIRQPSRIWYRPKNLKELKDLTHQAYEADIEKYKEQIEKCKGQDEAKVKEIILANYIELYNGGGLFARTIKF